MQQSDTVLHSYASGLVDFVQHTHAHTHRVLSRGFAASECGDDCGANS